MVSNTLADYDDLPYDSVPLPQTHPNYLAALAHLAGFAAPDPAAARILEIGCAEGGNLLPIAFYWPQTQCTGIELSRVQAATGQALIAASGAANCRILHADLSALPADFGEFDYIVAHGVYSWVPPAVQEALLARCARHLAANGVAYVSFNVLPGWGSRQALRAELLRRAPGHDSPPARVAAARRVLEDLAADFGRSRLRSFPDLEQEIAFLLRASPAYLFHEYLAAHNAPETFARFRERAARNGLACLGDAGPALCARAWQEQLWSEEQFDAASGTRFRRALLVHAAAPRRARGNVDSLACHADLRSDEEIDLGSALPQAFFDARGIRLQVRQPRVKAALLVLGTIFPDSLEGAALNAAADDLLRRYGAGRNGADAAVAAAAEWQDLLAAQAVWPGAATRSFARDIGERPRANRLARALAARGMAVTGARHLALDLDAAGRELLLDLDGRHDRSSLMLRMRQRLDGQGIAAEPGQVEDTVERFLALFARNALIEG